MTLYTSNELSALAFRKTVEAVQEGSVTGNTPSLAAFLDIVPRAQDGSQSAALIGAMSYHDAGGKATSTRNKFKVKPSMSDFVVDVQNIARKFLTSDEHAYFTQTYLTEYLGIADELDRLDLTPDGKDKYMEQHLSRFKPEDRQKVRDYDTNIRTKLGAAFIEHGLHPFDLYMNLADEDIETTRNKGINRTKHVKGHDPECVLCKRRREK